MNRDKQQLIHVSYGSLSSRVKADLAELNRSFHPAYHSEQLRMHAHLMTKIEWLNPHQVALSLPLYSSKVSAGFPSPAEDHVEKR